MNTLRSSAVASSCRCLNDFFLPFFHPFPRLSFPRVGLQDRVEPRVAADPALAFHPGAAAEGGVPPCHRLAAGRVRGVRHQGPRRSGPAVGQEEMQTPDELRQAEPGAQVSRSLHGGGGPVTSPPPILPCLRWATVVDISVPGAVAPAFLRGLCGVVSSGVPECSGRSGWAWVR